MVNTTCIRPVNQNDADFIHTLMNNSSVMLALNEIPTSKKDWTEAISEWSHDEDEEDYIILDGMTPIGWIGINGLQSNYKSAYIKIVAILPEYQNRGYGTKAIQELMFDLKLKGFEKILLYTDKENLKAQACYQRCGFQVVELLTETMSNGKDVARYLMETHLK